jgi:hypothetical protein
MDQWLNAYVAIERAMTTVQGTSFQQDEEQTNR